MIDLNPCPKCEYSEPELLDITEFNDYHQITKNRFWVGCRNCGYYCPLSLAPTAEGAAERWNSLPRKECAKRPALPSATKPPSHQAL